MKKIFPLFTGLFFLLLLSCGDTKTRVNVVTAEAVSNDARLLRHVVLFQYKESATVAEKKAVEEAFKALPAKIPQIHSFEWGTNNSPEGLDKGFTHCFLLTFLSEEDRAVYLPHPDHEAFGAVLQPILEDVLVVDYWAG